MKELQLINSKTAIGIVLKDNGRFRKVNGICFLSHYLSICKSASREFEFVRLHKFRKIL